MNIEPYLFPNTGFLKISLSKEQTQPIIDEIKKIQKDFELGTTANHLLVGNIRKEFELVDSLDYLNELLPNIVQEYENHFRILREYSILTERRPMRLANAWVNFQEKYEFNPVHDHDGILSFVLWVKIPYKMKDEINASPGCKSKAPLAGTFCFYYTDSLGKIRQYDISADETMENTMLLFPAKMNHSVHPFYSSDEYRISVSGNVVFQV